MSNRRKIKAQKHATRSGWAWLGVIVPVTIVAALVAIGGGSDGDSTPAISAQTPAVMFELPATDGTIVSLQEILTKSDVLLYFSMGVGCDGCFSQIPEVEQALAARDIALMPIMVQSESLVNATAQNMGISKPILIDENRSVSEAYNMLGVNGHNDRPFHSIALVKQDGTLAYVKHYNSMFIGSDEMMADLLAVS